MKGKTTIHDIARKLNVTASTVSRALKDHPRISAETKRNVLRTARKLNYQPNHIAAALRNGRSNILGIIVPTVDRTIFSSAVRGIEEIANAARYNVMICQTYDNAEKEIATVEALLNARVDGIIASYGKATTDFDHFIKVKEKGIPLILFDRFNDDLNVSQVVIDDFLGAFNATQHLIDQGCKRIAHFTDPRKISIYEERLRGYKEALRTNGLPFDQSLVVENNLQLEDGRSGMLQLLTLPQLPDAVFSASAYALLGAMQVLKSKGINIPEQVALAGFSDEPFASVTDPGLTMVDQHSLQMGNAAAEIFLREISDETRISSPQKIILVPDLIVRDSSIRKKNL